MDIYELIESHEGYVAHVYDDATGKAIVPGYTVEGHPTIGIGTRLDQDLPRSTLETLFHADTDGYVATLMQYPWFAALDNVRQAAVTDAAYNLGIAGLLGFHNTIAALAARNWNAAAQELLDSKAARQLPSRYGELAEMIRTGNWPA